MYTFKVKLFTGEWKYCALWNSFLIFLTFSKMQPAPRKNVKMKKDKKDKDKG
jgi:hypothetical protein